jgi:8-oxo-dGTP pyrophosphatase MutT (NUDIX family)
MKYKDFYRELITEQIKTTPVENQNVEVGDLVNIRGNRGGGGWEVVKIGDDGIYLNYGHPAKPVRFDREKVYVVEKSTRNIKEQEIDSIIKNGSLTKEDSTQLEPKEIKNFKKLGGNEWLELREMETPSGPYTYSREVRCNGKIISILPYRRVGRDAWEIGVRQEITPCWGSERSLSSVTGGVDEGEEPNQAAKRELFEETGYDVDISKIENLGTIRGTKSSDTMYYLFAVDLTDAEEPSEPKGDGTERDLAPLKWMYINKGNISDPMVYVCYQKLRL